MVEIVIKRTGEEVAYDREKIYNAILKAMKNGLGIINEGVARHIADSCEFHFDNKVDISDIEDYVFNELVRLGESQTARHYVEYKAVRSSIRKYKHNVFDQMQDVMDLKSEDIRDNANKSGDKITSLRAMFSDIACKEFVKERITPEHLAKEQEKLIYEHDRNYRNIPMTNCELCNYKDMMENGFHVGTTHIHDIKGITTAIAILSQIIAHVTSATYGGCTIQRIDERLEPYMIMSYEKHLQVAKDENVTDKEGYAWRRLRKEVKDGCQGLEYEINTLMNARAETPFITISLGLGTSKFSQLFQEEYLKVRKAGFDGLTPVFPKLLFITKKGLNRYSTDPQYYLYQLAISTSAVRLYPDYQSYEKCVDVTGSFKSPMGEILLPL